MAWCSKTSGSWVRPGQHSRQIDTLDLDMVSNLELVLVFHKVGKGKDLITTTVDRGSRKFSGLEDICLRRSRTGK